MVKSLDERQSERKQAKPDEGGHDGSGNVDVGEKVNPSKRPRWSWQERPLGRCDELKGGRRRRKKRKRKKKRHKERKREKKKKKKDNKNKERKNK